MSMPAAALAAVETDANVGRRTWTGMKAEKRAIGFVRGSARSKIDFSETPASGENELFTILLDLLFFCTAVQLFR